MTRKQQFFVKEYLIDLNATKAAIRAGYSQKTAYRMGFENLNKPQIQAEIQAAMDERSARTEITSDQVLKNLDAIKADAMRITDELTGMRDRSAAIKALELQGKHLGMWTDRQKIDISGTVGGNVKSSVVHVFIPDNGRGDGAYEIEKEDVAG